jgi:hypothetical protein
MRPSNRPADHFGYADPIAACSFCTNAQLRRERVLGESVGVCSECRGLWVSLDRLFRLDARKSRTHYSELAFESKAANVYAFPVALTIGALSHFLWFSMLFSLVFPFGLGALPGTIVAWLGGFPAQPLSLICFDDYEERRAWVIVLSRGSDGAVRSAPSAIEKDARWRIARGQMNTLKNRQLRFCPRSSACRRACASRSASSAVAFACSRAAKSTNTI